MEYVNTQTKIDYLIHICTAIMISSFIIFDMDYRVSYILLGMTILIFGLLALRNNFKIEVKIESFHRRILLFILYAACSSIWSYTPYLAIRKAVTITEILICMSVLYIYYSGYDSLSDLYTILMISGFIVVIYSFYRYGIANILLVLSRGDRLDEIFSNVNSIAMIVSVAIIAFIYKVLFEKMHIFSICVCCCMSVLGIVIIAATGSRKALVILVLGGVLLFSVRFKSKNFLITVLEVFTVIVVMYFVLSQLRNVEMFKGIVDRMDGLVAMVTGKGAVDASASTRAEFITVGIEQFKKQPIWGYGMGNSGKVLVNAIGGKETYFHNNYVELLVCGGFIGTSIYYMIWLKPIKELLVYRKYDTTAIFSIIMAAILLAMDYGLVTYFDKLNYFYIMIMYICAKNLRRKRDESEEGLQEYFENNL